MSGHFRSKASYAKDGLRYLFISVSGWILLKDALLDATLVTGQSMAPTLSPLFGSTGAADCILWWKHLPTRNLRRGDVVLFCTPHKAEGKAVKRVVALGGDTVRLDPKRRPADAQNGRPSDAGKRWDIMFAQHGGKVEIPQGHVWVEGDNWRLSHDSNSFGPISRSLITGKAVSILLPWRQFGQTPWNGWKSRTKVIHGHEIVDNDAISWEPV